MALYQGMTAPVFFTVSGLIFTYLLIMEQNPEKWGGTMYAYRSGVRRGISFAIIAYLLRSKYFQSFF